LNNAPLRKWGRPFALLRAGSWPGRRHRGRCRLLFL